MSDSADPKSSSPRRHRVLVGVMLTLAVVIGFIAIFSTWINRQALNTNNWTNTSSKILADPEVQAVLGPYLVNALFSNVDVAAQLRNALPPQTAALAGPAASGLHGLADQLAPDLLARPRIQAAWREANRAASKQLLAVLNGGNGAAVSTANGQVTLDLHALVTQLASTLGISSQVSQAQSKLQGSGGAKAQQKLGVTLPPNSGKLVILRSNQLSTAQDIAKAIRHLSIIFTAVSLALFAGAVALAAGRRRLTLRTTGWCFVGLGIFTLFLRRVGGDQIVESLVRNESAKPAAHSVWSIATGLLYAIAVAMVIYGLVVVIAAWLAGDTRPAVAVRRAFAPAFRDRPVLVYGVATFFYLLVLWWGPTPALRHWIPILLIAGLLVLGIELLRRQAAREFPDARAGDTMQSIRAWMSGRRERPTEVPAGSGNGVRVEQLERLASLHESGELTDTEYSQEKTALLGSH